MCVKLAVGVPYFVTDPLQLYEIKRALDSIPPDIKVYGIDGRFIEFPHSMDYSIPECNQMIRALYNNVEIHKVCATQLVKRQTYLDLAGKDNVDYLMVMDSEEYIHPMCADWGSWAIFTHELEDHLPEEDMLYFLWFWVHKEWIASANPVVKETWQKYIRIHKYPGKQKYFMNHFTWRLKTDDSVSLNGLKASKTLSSIKLTGDSKYRTKEFLDSKAIWEQEDRKKEMAREWIGLHRLEQLSKVFFPENQP